MDEGFRLATKSYLAYLKGMTESCPVEARTGKEYLLDFFLWRSSDIIQKYGLIYATNY
jgi:hypothetical protein